VAYFRRLCHAPGQIPRGLPQMMKVLLAGIVALSASGAFAADAIEEPVYNEPTVYNWTGFYVGAQAGYGWGDSRQFEEPDGTDDYTIDGFVGGGTVGYNYQIDRIVLGVEADLSYADIYGTGDTSDSWGCADGCYTEVEWFGTARGRLGVAFDNILPYVTGGYAIGKAGAGFLGTDGTDDGSDTIDGYTVGGGVEYGLTENISLKAEYLHVHLGDFTFNTDSDWESEANFNVVRAGVNWGF
jgi:outer membrane immunogenic protein